MILHDLSVQSFRNLQPVVLDLHPHLNVFWGDNGSGKTSLLEAIYLLAMGRSFRTQHINHIIQQQADIAVVRAQVYDKDPHGAIKVSVGKPRNEGLHIKWADQPAVSLMEVAKRLPVQLLNVDSYQLLQDSPEARRKILDWIVFHVEHSYSGIWKQWQQVLRQRNAALRHNGHPLACWDEQLADWGQQVDTIRSKVLQDWLPLARQMVEQVITVDTLSMEYEAGWNKAHSLLEAMRMNCERDKQLGYTSQGPQRSDFKIQINKIIAHQRLSLGQQKRLICALLLSQNQWIAQQTGERSILLIDDLPSELDLASYRALFQLFADLKAQIFITSVSRERAEILKSYYELKMFHVEHGVVHNS